MEPIGSVTRAPTLEALVAAWSDAANGAQGLVDATPSAGASQAPGSAADHTVEAATLQTLTRLQAPASDPLRPNDIALPSLAHPGSQFALPGDQLIPLTLVGLQVDAGALWAMQRRGPDTSRVEPHATERDPGARRDDTPNNDEEAAADSGTPADAEPELPVSVTEGDSSDSLPVWSEPLTRALRGALAAPVPPAALMAAMAQWLRGRCVVLACPQGDGPAGAAWAFVLWPRPHQPLAWQGCRVAGRLHGVRPPSSAHWCLAEAMKEHHPRRGRQLRVRGRAPALDVQLGPVVPDLQPRADVHLRVDAVRPFWAALGAQWSVTVVICSQPLMPPEPAGVSTC